MLVVTGEMMTYCLTLLWLLVALMASQGNAVEQAKDNGDVYVIDEEHLVKIMEPTMAPDAINQDEVMRICNSSFSIPMSYLEQFNATAELPDVIDKTGMCYIRCWFEQSGLIDNWKLNVEKIRANIWPATGDSIDFCEKEQQHETNACVRLYAIAKCLMLRVIVDARNKPMV